MEEGHSDVPAVTVVMAFLNGERFLAEAIDSVLHQTWRDLELILVDDGSTDSSRAIADRYAAADWRVRVIAHPDNRNLGLSASRNAGIAAARAARIALIDADDRWPLHKLSEQMAIMDRHPEVALLAGATRYWRSWDGGQDEIKLVGAIRDQPIPPPLAALTTYPLAGAEAPTPSSWLVCAKAIQRVGGFEAHFRGPYGIYEDQAFLAKMYMEETVYFSSRCWLDYRQHAASMLSSGLGRGDYTKVRTYFLNWFAGYLASHPDADHRVVLRVRKARARLRLASLRDKIKRATGL